jgi:tetratricopeptide (TPR) repeat protein
MRPNDRVYRSNHFRLDKAIAYAQKAVEQAPNYANVHNILGIAWRYNGQYDEAISSFKKTLKLDLINKPV